MKYRSLLLILTPIALLSGCATSTIRSNVTAFNEWPASLPDKSFVFERTKAQDQDLEYRSYENLVRAEVGTTRTRRGRARGETGAEDYVRL